MQPIRVWLFRDLVTGADLPTLRTAVRTFRRNIQRRLHEGGILVSQQWVPEGPGTMPPASLESGLPVRRMTARTWSAITSPSPVVVLSRHMT